LNAAVWTALPARLFIMPEHCAFWPGSLHDRYAEAAAVKFPELAAAMHAAHSLPDGGFSEVCAGSVVAVGFGAVVVACVVVVEPVCDAVVCVGGSGCAG